MAIVGALAAACNHGSGGGASQCPSDRDALLAQAGLSLPARQACGSFSAGDDDISAAYACLKPGGAPPSRTSELSVNLCIDCVVASTFVITPDGDAYEVIVDSLGVPDRIPGSRVYRCSDVVEDAESDSRLRCVDPEERYACDAPAD